MNQPAEQFTVADCVLDFVVDASVPPLPPQVTRKQAQSYFEAIEKGDPDADAIRRAIRKQSSDS